MKRHILITLLTLCLGAIAANAQIRVQGTVVDKDGLAVIGAGVVEQGTTNGTTTGSDGKYSLTVKSESSVLEFSCIGYQTVQQTVGTRQTIDLTMEDDNKLLRSGCYRLWYS